MITTFPSTAPETREYALQEWIDDAVQTSTALAIAERLTEATIPGEANVIGPILLGGEGWYWPWNRAGFHFTKKGRGEDAATIFTAAYLAALRNQADLGERLPKRMPLCNIAYACTIAAAPFSARVPAALAVVEDALASKPVRSASSVKNLLAAGADAQWASALADHVLRSFAAVKRDLIYPELALASFLAPAEPPTQLLSELDQLARSVSRRTVSTCITALRRLWSSFDVGIGVNAISERFTNDRGPRSSGGGNGGTTSGSRASRIGTAIG